MRWYEVKKKIGRRLLVPIVAIAATASLVTYEFVKPASAAAPAPAPAAAALDDNSVSALLALDHAMEAVAARVTPATVNVTVTSKASHNDNDAEDQNGGSDDDSNGMQQFFGPFGFGPFGRNFRMQPQQPQIEH